MKYLALVLAISLAACSAADSLDPTVRPRNRTPDRNIPTSTGLISDGGIIGDVPPVDSVSVRTNCAQPQDTLVHTLPISKGPVPFCPPVYPAFP